LYLPFFKPTSDNADLGKVAPIIGIPGCGIFDEAIDGRRIRGRNQKALEKGHKLYLNQITRNHGMAYNYQFNLLALIGVDINGFDPTFKSGSRRWRP